jgi:putative transposase
MPNTYSQINIHAIYAVKGRGNLLYPEFKSQLFRYISGILSNAGQFPLAVNGAHDHVHMFFELDPVNSISEILRIVKSNSSKWINENHFVKGKFRWQEGYGAFSYARSARNYVINYIINQEEHHRKISFREEYLGMLAKFDISYDTKYLFEFYD